jgi:hypothetical protein
MASIQQLLSSYGSVSAGGISIPTANTILNFNGADGSTTITDDTGNHTWTYAAGTGTGLDTGQSKFGGSSLQIINADRITAPSHADWAFGTGDFTVAGWVWIPPAILSTTVVWFLVNTTNGCSLHIRSGKLTIGREGVAFDLQSTNNVPTNQWVHLAAARQSGTARGFINGALEFAGASAHNFQQGVASFGAKQGGSEFMENSWLDSSLVDKGTAIYTSAFTPPAGPYAP